MSDAKPLLRRRHAAQLFKTEICKFFLEGRCESGDACSYAHEKNEVRTKPDLTRTSMCRKLLTDGACNDKRCRFAHSEQELRATNGFFKMKMCFFAQSGKCKHGSRCRFAHTMDELRPAGPRKDPELPDVKSAQEEEQRQDPQIDLYSLSSLPERQKSSQQESHGTGGSTATGNGGSTSGNGGSTSGNASGQSSNENSGSGNSRREGDSRPHRGRAAMQARMRTQNMAEESSSSSGNTSLTLVPRSEHTGSTNASDSSSSGAVGNGDDAVEADGSAAGAAEQKTKTRRSQRRRTSSGESDEESKNQGEVTLIVSNLPVYLTRGALLSMFEDLTATMRGKFDFFHSPWDLKAGHSLGYAIINFTDSRQAAIFDQQWTDKNLLRKKHPPLKVRKASIQGLTANIEYFSKNLSCPDSRFVPLYRDAEGNMTPLELAVAGDVESQSVNSWKAEGLSAQKLGTQDLDTGQAGGASSNNKSAGETCRTVISGASRPEEHSLQESETRHRRRRNRRRSKQTSMAEAADASGAAEALQVAPEKLPKAPAAWSMPGVQPDLRQLALRQQHQQVLKTMAEKEERKHTKNQSHSQEAARSSQEAPDTSRLLEAQQLQMLAKQLQQFHASVQMSGMSGVAPTASSAMTWQADSFSQAPTPSTAPTGPHQFMVSPVPAGADSAQLALHMSRQAKQVPVADSQVYNAMSSDLAVGAVTGTAGPPGPPMAGPLVPYMMMPVQSVQPVQSLQAALANSANCANAMVAGNFAGGLRYLNGDEVYTD